MSRTFFTTGAGKNLAPKEADVGARLPYAAHLDAVTLTTRDGLLIQTLHLEGFPSETAPDEELNYRKAIRETVLRGAATSRLALYHHVVRRRVTPAFPDPPEEAFCARLDAGWRERLAGRSLYVNDIFLTLVRRPLPGGVGLLEKLVRAPNAKGADLERELRALTAAREAFAAALAPYGPRTLALYDGPGGAQRSEPAEFLSLILNGDVRPVLAPSGDFSHAIAARRLSFGLDAMEFGPAHTPASFGAMISLKDYPARTAPGLLDGVLRLPMELVLTESFAFVERQAALDRMGLALRRLRAADDDAYSLRNELAQARDDVGAGRAAYGEHHLTILAKADALSDLDASVADVQSALAEAGAIAVREDTNLEPAFWAQFPGNLKFIARKALVSAGNFAALASFHNHPTGQAEDNHWGPAIAVLETTSFGPYHFNFHNADLGNFTVIGPSGSGKTVLLTFLLAQAERLKPRIAYFDKDRGAEPFIRAIGGRYDVISPGEPTGFNPLALADNPENRAFLADWVGQLLTAEGGALDAEDRAMIAEAIDANFAQAPGHRRLRYLRELFRGARRPHAGDLAARLGAWCEGGEHAWLFDNASDRLDLDARILGFDMTKLLDSPIIRTPTMMYLFHRLEQRLDGSPAIIVVDEGWKALDDQAFLRRIKDWEKTIRKRNGLVGFCTQSASDALESRIASAIIEQAATQIFFPNSRARAADYVEGFGLTEHEFELVRSLPDTSRCFLIKRGDHSVVARLDLSGLGGELAVLAGTERTVRRLEALRGELGDEPDAWLEHFMAGRISRMSTCSDLVGNGVIRGVLGAVDCQTRAFAEAGYSSLSASSNFQTALTALLTIYVALVGYRMLFAQGGTRLSDAPGIALKIGAILALVTSWSTFQTLVFDLAAKAPGEIAAAVAAPLQANGGSLAADPAGGLQTAYDQLTQAAVAFGKMAGPNVKAYASPAAAAAEALSAATGVLFMTTAGIIAAATLAIGVLTAVGPVFIALFLIPATRGLFAGWLRALAAAAITPLLGWLTIILLLSVLEPWLVALARQRELAQLDPQTAMSAAAIVFVFGVGQVGLLIAASTVAFGLRLGQNAAAERTGSAAAQPAPAFAPVQDASRAQRLAFDLQRDEARTETRWRPAQLAAALSAPAPAAHRAPTSERPARLGDAYRRPAAGQRRQGART